MDAYFHAKSASRKWGGDPEDYIQIEEFIDSSKVTIPDIRHRAMYHHTLGVRLCQQVFGTTIKVGRFDVPVKRIAERHIIEDLGFLPTPQDYLKDLPIHTWFSGARRKSMPLSTLGISA